jgi:hypothetical protein
MVARNNFTRLFAAFIAATLLIQTPPAHSEDGKPAEQVVPIEGKVLDEARQPVAGAKVRVFVTQTQREGTTTDSEGRYRLTISLAPPPPSRVSLISIVADDFEGDRQGFARPFSALGPNGGALQPITLKPVRTTIIKVTDADGNPVEGATYAAPDSKYLIGDLVLTGKTDTNGIGRLRYPDDALVRKIIAFKSGVGFDYAVSPLAAAGSSRQSPLAEAAKLGNPFPDGVILRLRGARTLKIKSIGPDGQGVAGVRFNLREVAVKGNPQRLTIDQCSAVELTADDSGAVVFDWLPKNFAGEMRFFGGGTLDQPFTITRQAEDILTVHASHPIDEITLPLLRRIQISGHVYLPDGKPASGVAVAVEQSGVPLPAFMGGQLITQTDGSYWVIVPADGAYTLGVLSDRWAADPQTAVLKSDGTFAPVDFNVSKGTIVRGTITEGPDHVPVREDVSIVNKGADADHQKSAQGSLFVLRANSGLTGKFQFCVPPGHYTLQVTRYDLQLRDHRRFDFEVKDEAEIVRDFNLPLVPTTRLTGVVVDANDQPSLGPQLRLQFLDQPDHGSAGSVTATTKSDGTFSLDRPPGTALLSVVSADRASGAKLLITPDQREVALRMQPFVRVRGRLVDAGGQPVEEGFVRYGANAPVPTELSQFSPYADSNSISLGGDSSYCLESVTPGIEYNVVYFENRTAQRVLVTRFTAQPGKDLDLGDTPIPNEQDTKPPRR